MAQVKTSELTAVALDWCVAKMELGVFHFKRLQIIKGAIFIAPLSRYHSPRWANYCTDWAQAGPIIERERIAISFYPIDNGIDAPNWGAWRYSHSHHAHTPLIAAMRCYVSSKLGDVVEVPDELTK